MGNDVVEDSNLGLIADLIEEIEARLMILLHLEAIFEGIVEAEAEAEPQRREDLRLVELTMEIRGEAYGLGFRVLRTGPLRNENYTTTP